MPDSCQLFLTLFPESPTKKEERKGAEKMRFVISGSLPIQILGLKHIKSVIKGCLYNQGSIL
jgi:hypothetical protein